MSELEKATEAPAAAENDSGDTGYFLSYGDLDVHELMLKDKPRTLAYKHFIDNNKVLFKDKVVIDVGAGTGILSLFAARAGAKKVIAVEASDIADACQLIVQQNGLEDIITVKHSRVEDLVLPPSEKADILISEWMGFYLLHESMLDSVIYARDNLLKENGIVLPSKATIYLSPVNMAEMYKDKVEFWKDVYGFDYSPLIPTVVMKTLQSPTITTVFKQNLLGDTQKVIELDLSIVTLNQVRSFQKDFCFSMKDSCRVHGFVFWFDVEFINGSSDGILGKEVLSTSPHADPTHWKQTVFNLPAPLLVDANDDIKCRLELCQSDSNKRHYNITLELLDIPDIDTGDGCTEHAQTENSILNGDCAEEDLDVDSDSDASSEDHPTPCDCDSPRCKIIKALTAKYDEEDKLMESEDVIDISPDEIEKAIDISDNLEV